MSSKTISITIAVKVNTDLDNVGSIIDNLDINIEGNDVVEVESHEVNDFFKLASTDDDEGSGEYCPQCGHEFEQGESNYNYETANTDYECPHCGWMGTHAEVERDDDDK